MTIGDLQSEAFINSAGENVPQYGQHRAYLDPAIMVNPFDFSTGRDSPVMDLSVSEARE